MINTNKGRECTSVEISESRHGPATQAGGRAFVTRSQASAADGLNIRVARMFMRESRVVPSAQGPS